MKNHMKNTSKIYFKVIARNGSWNIFQPQFQFQKQEVVKGK